MAVITKEISIGELINLYEDAIPVLLDMGMHCLGCPASQGESLEEACMVHGVDADEIVQKINELITEK